MLFLHSDNLAGILLLTVGWVFILIVGFIFYLIAKNS